MVGMPSKGHFQQISSQSEVGAGLLAFLPKWATIGAPNPVLSLVQDIQFDFMAPPPLMHASWVHASWAWGDRVISGKRDLGCSCHINWLKLQAILLAVKEWAHLLRGATVAIQADKKTAIAYIL